MSAALFNAFARDWPVRIAMARTRDRPGYSSDTLVLRNDLREHGRPSPRISRARKIAINAPAVGAALHGRQDDGERRPHASTTSQTINMAWPNMAPGLATKAIDAGTVVEPFAAQFSRARTSPSRSSAPPTS